LIPVVFLRSSFDALNLAAFNAAGFEGVGILLLVFIITYILLLISVNCFYQGQI